MANSKQIYKKIVRDNRSTIVWLTILTTIFSLFLVAFAYVSKLLLDSVQNGTNQIVLFACILGGLIILEVFLKIVTNVSYTKCTLKLENKIKKETMFAYLNNDFSKLDNKNSADWINRITSDSKVVAGGIISFVPNVIALTVRIIASFVVLMLIDWKFATALVAIGILGFIISKIIRKKNKELHKLAQKEEDISLQFYKNSISHFFLIRLFNCEKKIDEQCDGIQDNYLKAKLRIREFSIFINTAFTFAMRISYLGAIIYAAILISNGNVDITYGSLLAMVQLISQIEVPFTSLSGLLPQYYQTLGSIERIEEFKPSNAAKELMEKVEFTDKITAKGLSFRYSDKDNELFSNLDFEINKGDFVLIKGHSGCGKTTLIKIIMGMYQPTTGSVSYLGNDIANSMNMFAYVPQGNFLINGSVKDNLTLFCKDEVNEDRINEVLKFVCLDEKVKSLSKGLDTVLGDEGSGFSIGEGQRLSIARALLTNRDVLVLDEASSALDQETAHKVIENIKNSGKTVIMISHKNESFDFASKVIELGKE